MRKSTPTGPLTPAIFRIPLAFHCSEAVNAALAGLKRWQEALGLPTSKRILTIGAMTVTLGSCAAILAGCASANVTSIASTNTSTPRPAEILVDVRPAFNPSNPSAELAADVSAKLQSALIKKLTKAGITAEAYAPGMARAGAATLHVAITGATPGNTAERILIGFGVGQAKLQASAELETVKVPPGQSMTNFVVFSNSGYQPGMIMPAGVAGATGNMIHFAIGGGIKLVTSSHGGMSAVVDETTTAITGQLEKYYEQVGWIWRRHGRHGFGRGMVEELWR
jgi:hypothetical protein